MRIRLEGTRDEVENAAQALALGFEVLEVSGFYPNRGASVLGRVYVTATVLPAHLLRARSTRMDTSAPRLDSDPPPQLTS
ncbi:hypothetical protein SK571_40870 [Lentzea sp. BCCO 10_0798]|uniref:Uncharacterized protein n=1 Tax=Lentzea kristufekii TaxID=3095430 RepID=A0ABU4U5Z1_9PSEU|nr:hypothetical protein [Lentzea sp. BCCO 10_0798]MDX8055768.1 hypothetical protein [Lentzea sp. BCCO 10_0798]